MAFGMRNIMELVGLLLLFGMFSAPASSAKTRHYKFVIRESPYRRLCHTKNILTVNGEFPGPTIYARKGDAIIVQVSNHASYNISLHWHGVDQPGNPWSDGPEYITQCPIRPGSGFKYKIMLTEEEGTIWWHAHSDWDRATVHGAIVVYPEHGATFPFPMPHKEIPIILGEWWKSDVKQVLAEGLRTGRTPNVSDAHTINGQPGDLFPCSKRDTFTVRVQHGKTYLLRLVNAAINDELFFAVAGHRLTVVGTDASYTKPFTTNIVLITPGQTMDLLLVADASPNNRYYIAAKPYATGVRVPYDKTTATAIVEYPAYYSGDRVSPTSAPLFPQLPADNGTDAAIEFTTKLRSLHDVDVPKDVDERLIITIAINVVPCSGNITCQGPGGARLMASLNNVSFVNPTTSILEAYYHHIKGVYSVGFPSDPPFPFNFTGETSPTFSLAPRKRTEVRVLEYNKSVEVVFQGTSLVAAMNHPMHLHGQSFYVVGSGFGNFDEEMDPRSYNLEDPPYENTVGVPKNGWTAIRFRTKNPGVWLMHCHLDRHVSWGMKTVFIVKNGATPESQILPPPKHMPRC